MIRILLIRHANADGLGSILHGRTPGVHLNAAGEQQARMLGNQLKTRYEIDEVWSSPLERANETARSIAEAQGLPVSMDEGLNEFDVGSWMGKPFSELETFEEWKQFNRIRSTARAPGGESMLEVQARSWSALERIIERHTRAQEATLAIVTHGDVIRALLLLFLGIPLDHIHRLQIDTASVSEVLMHNRDPIVRTLNVTCL